LAHSAAGQSLDLTIGARVACRPEVAIVTYMNHTTMKTCYLYSLVLPVLEEFRDNRSIPPLAAIPVKLKDGREWETAILGDQTTIRAVRISIPNVSDEKIDPEDFRRFLRLRGYLLDCIRLVYDRDAEYLRRGEATFAMWNFLEPDKGPDFAINVTEPLNPDYRVNVDGLKHLIAAVPNMRPIIHLIADGMNCRLPTQFRFLSYYKIIEMHYRVTPNKKFNEFICFFVPEFQEVYPDVTDVAQLCRRLSKLRDRCAHIKLRTGDLGFSHLQAETDELSTIMPVITRVASRCIRINYPDSPLRLSATPEEGAAQFAEMEAAGLRPVRVF